MRASLVASLLVAVVSCNGGEAQLKPNAGGEAVEPEPTPHTPLGTRSGAWKPIEALENDEKYAEAATAVDKLAAEAHARGDDVEYARALIEELKLGDARGEFETTARKLTGAPLPSATLPRLAVDLYAAQALFSYLSRYQWEIGRREHVATAAADLKQWTQEQIVAAAMKYVADAWARRVEVGADAATALGDLLEPNDYPPGVRDTLRDVVTYLAVEWLGDTAYWTPTESAETWRLDLKALLADDPARAARTKIDDADVHPVVRLVMALDDLAAFHARRGQLAGELEARREKASRLEAAFTDAEARKTIRDDLTQRLARFRAVPWWSMGMSTVANLARAGGDLVLARKVADEGWHAWPDSPGGRACRRIVAELDAPSFTLQAMQDDAPDRRSVEVTHTNVPRLFFRAWPVDLARRLAERRARGELFAVGPLKKLDAETAAATWTAELPPTPDLRAHRTFVTPPLPAGNWIVAASLDEKFATTGNHVAAAMMHVGALAVVRRDEPGFAVAQVVSAGRGEPVAGAKVTLYRDDWRTGPQAEHVATTDADGVARLPVVGWGSTFLTVEKGDEFLLDRQGAWGGGPRGTPPPVDAALVYTDRAIYRPGQKLLWKVVAYHGDGERAHLAATAGRSVTVRLRDGNYQEVAKATVTTNSFGSAAGSFDIPTGRMLGGWRIETTPSGSASVRVEEYKRPTFEVALDAPSAEPRLNRPLTVVGHAKYYFGLPVTSGAVKWRVVRTPVWPLWWGWFGWSPVERERTVASGAAEVGKDGSFECRFTPEADEKQAKSRDVSWSYALTADFTDEGGETRSASRTFRVGFVGVEATISVAGTFVRAGAPGEATVVRSTLDGEPRAGKGSWHLVAVQQPAPVLPSELPVHRAPVDEEGEAAPTPATPGDLLRARWDTHFSVEAELRAWPDGDEKAHGTVDSDAKGEAKIALPALPAGVWRLRYETLDAWGEKAEAVREIVVAGPKTPLALPLVLEAESSSVKAGEKLHLLAGSPLAGAPLWLDKYRDGKRVDHRLLPATGATLVDIPVGDADRGGFTLTLSGVRDHQLLTAQATVFVPWDDKELKLSFATFRDTLRPGQKETWRVTVTGPNGHAAEAGAAELLAYMYDRSLDAFATLSPPSVQSLYPSHTGAATVRATLGALSGESLAWADLVGAPPAESFRGDALALLPENAVGLGRYGTMGRGGGAGFAEGAMGSTRRKAMLAPMPMTAAPAPMAPSGDEAAGEANGVVGGVVGGVAAKHASARLEAPAPATPAPQVRSNFAETAFWLPSLTTDGKGQASIEFEVPDSVTSWTVWVHALTRDLRGGSITKEVRTVKDLMVRPYLPRFLREGDEATIEVVVNDGSDRPLDGTVSLDVVDAATQQSLRGAFAVTPGEQKFSVAPGGGAHVAWKLTTPKKIGQVAFRVVARAGDVSDGELRPLPILPSRLHLAQSRFVALHDADRRVMTFADMKTPDPTRTMEGLVVTVDAQLLYTALRALPYLVRYPYECTEQTMNRFVSTSILSAIYAGSPAMKKMAEEMAKRPTRLEPWDKLDPNRKMALEETPWVQESQGGAASPYPLIDVLDPRVAGEERVTALAKLRRDQLPSGAFPWFAGGPPSPYITLVVLEGFARAAEFGVEVPKDVVVNGWHYIGLFLNGEQFAHMKDGTADLYLLNFLSYVATAYPDPSWLGNALPSELRAEVLQYCFDRWKQLSPMGKSMLALALHRSNRDSDGKRVFAAVMDGAKTTPDQGTFWAPEDRSWLWYNDDVAGHAFALRTLAELFPDDKRQDGLMQWLFLDKKLDHWRSTIDTAEAIYALVAVMKREGTIGIREEATVRVGPDETTFVFEPDQYQGKAQVVLPGDRVDPRTSSSITVEKPSKGIMFASATWTYATDELPKEARGDFFSVERTYFKRELVGKQYQLTPLADGATFAPGDELEVHLSLRTKHEAEYVHLRDPRGAGFEPEDTTSGWKWDTGIGYYEEIRDSGTNFFFERLPQGEYTFKYRVRAATAGKFRVGPATVQSMYAPEFNAFSAGNVLTVVSATK